MKKTVIIGIGNPLRGDDGAGWVVVEALLANPLRSVTAVSSHQLLPELLEPIHAAKQVIFVDASVVGEPGEVAISTVQPATDGPASSHQLPPAVLLAMGVELYGRMPPASLITITGQSFGYQETLSPPVKQAIAEVVRRIVQIVEK
jgi:hydrogenase maturation protease